MAAVDFFSSFGYQWGQSATSYGWDDAQWKNGWLSIGSTPPSVGQFDAVQKITDLKLKYVFDAINSIATSGGLTLTSENASSLSTVLYRNATTALRGMVILASAAEVQAGTEATKAVTSSTLNSRTATEARTGMVELATPAEVIAGTDATRAVTPAGLAANVASTTNSGTIMLASAAEVQAGADAAKAVTSSTLAARTSTTARTGLIQLATVVEAQTGTDAVKAIAPAVLRAMLDETLPVGAIILCGTEVVPPGYLICNGAAISRTTYARLFAAIGTRYGAGNGSTTFNLPELRGEFPRFLDEGRTVDNGRAIGSWQAGSPLIHDDSGSPNLFSLAWDNVWGKWADPWIGEVPKGVYGGAAGDLYSDASTIGFYAMTRPRNVALCGRIKF